MQEVHIIGRLTVSVSGTDTNFFGQNQRPSRGTSKILLEVPKLGRLTVLHEPRHASEVPEIGRNFTRKKFIFYPDTKNVSLPS